MIRVPIFCLLVSTVATVGNAQLAKEGLLEAAVRSGGKTEFDAAYYAKQAKEQEKNWRAFLKGVGEPDIKSLSQDRELEIYRFVYNPHFSKALFVTTRKANGKRMIGIRRLSEKLETEVTGSVYIDEDTFVGLHDLFSKPQVKNPLAGLSPGQQDALWGVDGAWWHLETLVKGQYTHAIVWCPEAMSRLSSEDQVFFRKEFGFDPPDLRPFENACLMFVQLSGLPLDAKFYDVRPETNAK